MKNLADSLSSQIDRHKGSIRDGALISYDLEGLAAYLLVSPEIAQKFIARGLIESRNPTRSDDPNGRQSYSSEDLNDLRRAVLTEIVGECIDQADSEEEIAPAANYALKKHVEDFGAKPRTTNLARIVEEDDESDPLGTAAKIGAAGVAGYAGLSYLRGKAPGLSPFQAIKAGNAANLATAGRFANAVRPGIAKAATAVSGLSDAAKAAGAAFLRARVQQQG